MNHRTIYYNAFLAGLLIVGWVSTSAQAQDDAKAAIKKDKTCTNPINFTFDVSGFVSN